MCISRLVWQALFLQHGRIMSLLSWFCSTLCTSSLQGTNPGCKASLSHLAQIDWPQLGQGRSPVSLAFPMTPLFPSFPPVDLRADLQAVPEPDKVRFLTESVMRISSELNRVLGVLGSLSNQQPPLFTSTPRDSTPVSTCASLPGLHAGGSLLPPPRTSLVDQLAWSSEVSSSNSSAAGRSADSILADKWHKYFPGE